MGLHRVRAMFEVLEPRESELFDRVAQVVADRMQLDAAETVMMRADLDRLRNQRKRKYGKQADDTKVILHVCVCVNASMRARRSVHTFFLFPGY